MMKKRFEMVMLMTLLCVLGAKAQFTTAMRINEVLVINENNKIDDYGKHASWIELYNSSAGAVNLKGCYLTDDKNNPTKYQIQSNDVNTNIQPRQHVLFWADGNPSLGTFHLNFTLDPNKENYLALYDSDGKKMLDEITIPVGQVPDVSFGLIQDGVRNFWRTFENPSASTNNSLLNTKVAKIENLKANDEVGLGMTVTAMMVVFAGLLVLFFVFSQVGKAAVKASKRNAEKATGKSLSDADPTSGAVYAAIATALYEFDEEVHDLENAVLTIHEVKRKYSPWSSKIQTLRQQPNKK